MSAGHGPLLVFVHGSAADADSWTSSFALLRSDFHVVAYDRRGTPRSPLPEGRTAWSVSDHALELVDLTQALRAGPAVLVGSSFGAICALEAARRSPDSVRGLVLIEPPLPEDDGAASVAASFIEGLLRVDRDQGGAAMARFFLKTVLGRPAFEALPQRWLARSEGLHAAIRLDAEALLAYRPRLAELRSLECPTFLVGGGRSGPQYRATLNVLSQTLPKAQLEIIAGAGHMLHAQTARTFAELVRAFVERLPARGEERT